MLVYGQQLDLVPTCAIGAAKILLIREFSRRVKRAYSHMFNGKKKIMQIAEELKMKDERVSGTLCAATVLSFRTP
jgi:hypothetical protein